VTNPAGLTARESARLIGVPEGTFTRWAHEGRILGVKVHGRGRTYYREVDVLALRDGVTGGNTPEPPRPIRRRGIAADPEVEQLDMAIALEQGLVDPDQAQALWRRGVVALVRRPGFRLIAGGMNRPYSWRRLALQDLRNLTREEFDLELKDDNPVRLAEVRVEIARLVARLEGPDEGGGIPVEPSEPGIYTKQNPVRELAKAA